MSATGSDRQVSSSDPLLRVRDLRAWFSTDRGVARAVDGVSFDVRSGRTVGVVGESGSGKSVMALAILGLLPRSRADIRSDSHILFRGEDLTSASESRLQEIRGNEIAMIFQEPMTSLNPVMRIGDQISEALVLHRGLRGRTLREETVSLLNRVGIPEPAERVDAYPHQLSGGMRQRVMIAMALSCRPSLLIADEPTTALDVTVQAQILDLLLSLQEQLGMAIILITHDLGVVSEMADDVVVMYAGQVVERGPASSVLRQPAHPYTEGLLASMPDLGRRRRRLAVIRGFVPEADAWPTGCRFSPRCRHAWEKCGSRMPELERASTRAPRSGPESEAAADSAASDDAFSHHVRCWLEEEPHRRSAAASGAGAE